MEYKVVSSKYPGGSYRNKFGATCNDTTELLNEIIRLINLSEKEGTEEVIRIAIKQDKNDNKKRVI